MTPPLRPALAFAAILTTTWPNGQVQFTPCLSVKTCLEAAHFDLERGAKAAHCSREMTPEDAGFAPGWDAGIQDRKGQ